MCTVYNTLGGSLCLFIQSDKVARFAGSAVS